MKIKISVVPNDSLYKEVSFTYDFDVTKSIDDYLKMAILSAGYIKEGMVISGDESSYKTRPLNLNTITDLQSNKIIIETI